MNQTSDSRRRGACPAAGAPMASGDGLLSRVRLLGGRIRARDLARVAGEAERRGNGLLDITRRGNLQVRGLDTDGESRLTAALERMGLAVTPSEAEAARNVLTSAAADLDPEALIDPYPVAEALDQALVGEPDLWALPSKFRFVVCATALSGEDADVRADAVATGDGTLYRLALAGNARTAQPLGLCTPAETPQALLSLARFFLRANARRREPAGRLAPVLAQLGAEAFQRQAIAWRSEAPAPPEPRHQHELLAQRRGWLGVGVPFGRLNGAMLSELIAVAEECGDGSLRLTPQRRVLLPGVDAVSRARLDAAGLITADGDPRLAVEACPGASGCLSGTTVTQDDARAWARAVPELFDERMKVHVSGCPKGCAHAGAAPVTITAREGRYDLILADAAEPADDRCRIAAGLEPAEVTDHLQRLARCLRSGRRADESLVDVIDRLGPVRIRDDLADDV